MKRRLVSAVLSTVFLITGVISVSGCASKKNISQDRFIEYFDKHNYNDENSNYHYAGHLPDDLVFLREYLCHRMIIKLLIFC